MPHENFTVIRTKNLTKKYGDVYAIRDINLELEEGDLFGFIGPNGAGKTTTMRIIATLLNPSSGEAYVCGNSIYTQPKEIRRLVGYMPDFFGVYDDMKVIEYLEFFAAAYRIRGPQRRKRCDEMLEVVDLDFKRDAYANTLSRGQTQRLGLARVLLHDPARPAAGRTAERTRPARRIEMRNLLRRLGEMGKTIIVSSHILPELADICNKVGIIDRGVMSINATVADVMRKVRERILLHVQVADEQVDDAAKLLKDHDLVESVELGKGRSLMATLIESANDLAPLAQALVQANFRLQYFGEEQVSLEAAFMTLTKGLGSKI